MASAQNILYLVSIWAVPAILAITLHEAAHGFVAKRFGDDTAYRQGRVTFNPLKHIDPFGTILLPILLLVTSGGRFAFGWAKPVPVNFNRLRRPRRDMVWVAAAGPATNLMLALASGYLIHLAVLFPDPIGSLFLANLENSIVINAVLAVFNMLPLPPLDGGRVAVGLLPRPLARPLAKLERWGLFILIGFLFILPLLGDRIGVNLNVFPWLVGGPVEYLIGVIRVLTGIS
ncbi:MAG TPA: site-2 protease family protein [Alphaproteobacteria bacterium]|nr:site-2 protease family protein [Alphaproteobacteria bacterium]